MITQFKVPISLPEDSGNELCVTILILISFICLSFEVRLTKNLRGGLMFLDDHMSSSRRNKKHLKETFVCSSGSSSRGIRGALGKMRQRQVS